MRQFIWWGLTLAVVAEVVAIVYAVLPSGRFPRRFDFDSPNPAERVAALRAHPGDVGHLLKALHDEDSDVRLFAAMHMHGVESVQPLIGALKDRHAGVRHEAAESLCWLGESAVPALCEALADPDPRVRAGAALALSDVVRPKDRRRRSPDEVRTLRPLLRNLRDDKDPEVRKNAAVALEDLEWHPR